MSIEQMSWKILEYKFAYYQCARLHPSWKDETVVPDAVYDDLEDQYRLLCKEKNVEPSAADMVGFNFEKASCRLVALKLSNPKGMSFEKAKSKTEQKTSEMK
jgi:hypothetical protein